MNAAQARRPETTPTPALPTATIAIAACIHDALVELPWLKGADLKLVMGEAFCDWIGWGRE